MDELQYSYFKWLLQLVNGNVAGGRRSYRKLLGYLHSVEFTYILDRDANRADDGIELRYRFGMENWYPRFEISDNLDTRPCSVLEMMVALSLRCEDQMADGYNIREDLGQWFWKMIKSLGLYRMTDDQYDPIFVEEKIRIFLERRYAPDGTGGLFTIKNSPYDLRENEIWYQMSWYLDGLL